MYNIAALVYILLRVTDMTSKRLFQLLLIALALVAWVQVPLSLDQLPALIATHFDGAGNPNGWMTPKQLLLFWSGLIGFMVATFLGTPILTSRLSDRWINLPRKDYWLAPERRQQTLDRVAVFGLAAGCVCMAFLVVTIRLLLRANLDGTQHLDGHFIWYTLAFVALLVASSIAFTARFYRVPSSC